MFGIIKTVRERALYVGRSLGFIWASARCWTVAWLVLLIVQGLLPVATVYLTKILVDEIAAAAGSGAAWDKMSPIFQAGALMGAVLLLSEFLGNAIGWIRENQAELLNNYLRSLIHRKSVEVDLAFYESSEFYDHLHRASEEAGSRPMVLVENMGSAFQNGITLFAMAAVLIPYGLWLPAALLLSTLPAFYVILRFSLKHHKLWLETTPDERRSWYYDLLLTSGETAAELRLFTLGDHFRNLHQALRRRLHQKRVRLSGQQTIAQLAAGAAGLAITAGALAWMVWRIILGVVTLGDLALFYQAFNRGQGLMRSLLQNVGQIYKNSLFLGNLFEFLTMKPRVVNPVQPVRFPSAVKEGLSLENVSFRYPGSKRFALQNFNLRLPAGQITALVGPNGAGKSTLIKLICRFYDPEKGIVRLDGIDLHRFSLEELRGAITVLFQEPVHYNDTAETNISLGSIKRKPSLPEIKNAALSAGAHAPIASLPNGYETLLGKLFENGEELSVGEWQRIALARAFLRKAPILLLDEPTSAMDSWAEADWLNRLREHTKGQTVLIITHRFTTAMYADTIHVIERGSVVESGTHAQLAEMEGVYAESWKQQTNRQHMPTYV